MPFVALRAVLPELALRETRAIEAVGHDGQARVFTFEEMYCDEYACDCRRVMFRVSSDERGARQPRATLTFGWEPSRFYREWASFPLDDAALASLKGPGQAPLQPQSEDTPTLIQALRLLVQDPRYVDQLRRHYEQARALVQARGPTEDELRDDELAGLNRAQRRAARARRKKRRR